MLIYKYFGESHRVLRSWGMPGHILLMAQKMSRNCDVPKLVARLHGLLTFIEESRAIVDDTRLL